MEGFSFALRVAEEKSFELGVPRVGRDDGVVLYSLLFLLSSIRGRVVVVDAGAGVGYSTLWLLKALEDVCSDGVLYAVERDLNRFSVLGEVLKMYEVRCTEVRPIHGDAVEFVEKVFGFDSLDFVFVDIDKRRYFDMFSVLRGRLRRGGLAVFHNAYMVKDFVDRLFNELHRREWLVSVIPTNEGMLLIKKL